jgi:hypothetical protein
MEVGGGEGMCFPIYRICTPLYNVLYIGTFKYTIVEKTSKLHGPIAALPTSSVGNRIKATVIASHSSRECKNNSVFRFNKLASH